MANAKTASKLITIDVTNKNNLNHANTVHVGFSADIMLKGLGGVQDGLQNVLRDTRREI